MLAEISPIAMLTAGYIGYLNERKNVNLYIQSYTGNHGRKLTFPAFFWSFGKLAFLAFLIEMGDSPGWPVVTISL